MNILRGFVDTERRHYTNQGGNLLASSLGEALRYYDFLLIVTDRYKETSKKITSIADKSRKLTFAKPNRQTITMTGEQIRLFEEMNRLTTLVHLDRSSTVVLPGQL